jgi:hypothetical protein
MNVFGKFEELLRIIFRTQSGSHNVTVEPSSSTSQSQTFTLPESSGATDTIVARASTDQGSDRLTNKDLDDATTRLSDGSNTASLDLTYTGSSTIELPDSAADRLVGRATTDTLENKTLNSPVVDGTITGTAIDTDLSNGASANTVPSSQAVVDAIDVVGGDLADHIADPTDAHAASAITNTPAGFIAATTVQGAIDELDSEKLSRSGQNSATTLVLEPGATVDTNAAGNIEIGGTNATTINVGRTGQTTVIKGDLQVDGTTTTVNSDTLDVTDPNITLNDGGNDASSEGAGLTVERTSTDGSLIYRDSSASKFAAGPLGSEVDLVSTTGTQTITGKTIDGDNNTIQDLPETAIKTNVTNANKFFTRDGSGVPESSAKAVPTGAVVGTTDSQTLTGKTIDGGEINDDSAPLTIDASTSGLTLDGSVSGTMVKDEDDLVSNSDTHLATQQSIKTYVDNAVSAGAGGTGAGEINYIENGNFNVNTDGWVLYKSSAAPPVISDTTGTTSPTELTLTRDTSTHVIEGAASGRISHTSTNENFVGVSYDFIIPSGQRAQTQKVELTYYSSTVALAGDISVYVVKDTTGAPTIEKLGTLGFGTSDSDINRYQFRGTFKALAGIADYRLVVQHDTLAGAWDLFIDSIVVGSKEATVAPGIGKDGNLLEFGTGENLSGWARFEGDNTNAPPIAYADTDPANPSTINLLKDSSTPIWNNYNKVVNFGNSFTDGVQSEFFLPRALESTLLAFDFDYYVSLNTARTTGDLKVIFIGEDDTVVYPSIRDLVLPASASSDILKYRATVALPTSQKWRVLLQSTTAVSTQTSIGFDGVYLGTRNGAQQGFDGIWKTYTDADFTVTSAASGFVLDYFEITPEKNTAGKWFAKGTARYTFTATTGNVNVNVLGMQPEGSISYDIGVRFGSAAASDSNRAIVTGSNTQFQVSSITTAVDEACISFYFPLAAKPTWVDFDPIATVYPTTDDLAVTPWQPYTPSNTQGFGTITSRLEWRYNFDALEIRGDFTTGTVSAVEAQIALPNSEIVSFKNSTDTVNVGWWHRDIGSATASGAVLATHGDSFVNFGTIDMAGTDNPLNEEIVTNMVGSSQRIALFASIPIDRGATQISPIGIQLATPTQYGLVQAESGTYTPTITNVSNVTGTITPSEAKYIYVNGVVSVAGTIDTTAVNANTFNELGISLPFPKTVATLNDINGVGNVRRASTYTNGGGIVGDTSTNDRARLQIFNGSANGASHTYYYSFSYVPD